MCPKNRWTAFLLILAALAIVTANWSCTKPEPADEQETDGAATEESTVTSSGPPSRAELESATYTGVAEQPVTLAAGEWQGEPFEEGGASRPTVGLVKDFQLAADLNGNGLEEAIVLLWTSSGGSGTFDYVAVMERDGGGITNLGSAELGDAVKIRSAEISNSKIVFEVVQVGPDDARCCPGQKMKRSFALDTDGLAEISSEDLGRVSVSDLEGVEWVLTHLTWDETVSAEPEITLVFLDGGITGFSGCNRYNSEVSEGEMPGDLSVSLIAGTRMACPDELNNLETRYLQALASVNQYSFMMGKLVLSWSYEDVWNTMLFRSRPLPETPK